MASSPQQFPGFTNLKSLKSLRCACPQCGKIKEIFSGDLNRSHTCSQCGQRVDFRQRTLEGAAASPEPQ
ncbi:MAG: hypothetical protein PVG51_01635 [Desulfosarcina sp.]